MSSTPHPENNSQAVSPTIITKKDKIAAVADEILSLDKNVGYERQIVSEIEKKDVEAERRAKVGYIIPASP